MRILQGVVVVLAVSAAVSTVSAKAPKAKAKPKAAEPWIDGKVSYKFAGVDGHFAAPDEACKAGVDDLAKHGNKKTFVSVKDGTSSTAMTCVVKESDGASTDLANTVAKLLECPDTTSPRSTDNSGEFSKMRCHCDDAKGCPAPAKPAAKK
ncbi:hypothetical protein BH11MYX3_BH11MYX3_34240 [soil metagenome]